MKSCYVPTTGVIPRAGQGQGSTRRDILGVISNTNGATARDSINGGFSRLCAKPARCQARLALARERIQRIGRFIKGYLS
jgi:hypothetical protein